MRVEKAHGDKRGMRPCRGIWAHHIAGVKNIQLMTIQGRQNQVTWSRFMMGQALVIFTGFL